MNNPAGLHLRNPSECPKYWVHLIWIAADKNRNDAEDSITAPT